MEQQPLPKRRIKRHGSQPSLGLLRVIVLRRNGKRPGATLGYQAAVFFHLLRGRMLRLDIVAKHFVHDGAFSNHVQKRSLDQGGEKKGRHVDTLLKQLR